MKSNKNYKSEQYAAMKQRDVEKQKAQKKNPLFNIPDKTGGFTK